MAMSDWSVNAPIEEGWYLWRQKREADPWKWDAYYVMLDDDITEGTSYWIDGTAVNKPVRGVWSRRFDPDQTEQP